MLVPAPLLFLAFMGLQGRYFGRWLMPILPILCLLAAFFVLWLAGRLALRSRPARAPRARRAAARARRARRCAALLGARCCSRRALVYSVHSGLVLSRADTRNLTRAWMLAHVPRGREDRRRAGLAGRLGARSTPGALPTDAQPRTAGSKYPSLLSRIAPAGALLQQRPRRSSASRTTSARSARR